MKRLSMILMAGLLVLGLSQCKKENTNNNNEETEGVKITLTVDNGGEKVIITPSGNNEHISYVTYEDGDKILVVNDGQYVGCLEYSSSASAFSGNITETLSQSDKLHFIFVGNKVTPEVGATSCIVDMSDQSTGPAVISYASVKYNGESIVDANVTLLNKASGLVKFTTNIGTTNPVIISGSGMYNAMSITFGATPQFAPVSSTSHPNDITLYRYTGDTKNKTFLAVIPQQEALSGVTVTSVETRPAIVLPTVTIPKVTENMNYNWNGTHYSGVELMLDYPFTVSDDNGTTTKQVYFAPGNLRAYGNRYTASSTGAGWTWSFATNQWDYIGDAVANTSISGNGTLSTSGYVDLFGWSTDATYYGINNNESATTYSGDFKDWGIVANAANSGAGLDGYNNWYTLSAGEWSYMFYNHTRGMAIVNNVNGVIVLPKGTSLSLNSGNAYSSNTIDAATWASTYEPVGALFLPAACHRYGTDVIYVGTAGFYWTSSPTSSTTQKNARRIWIDQNNTNAVDWYNNEERSYGDCVRLARPVN